MQTLPNDDNIMRGKCCVSLHSRLVFLFPSLLLPSSLYILYYLSIPSFLPYVAPYFAFYFHVFIHVTTSVMVFYLYLYYPRVFIPSASLSSICLLLFSLFVFSFFIISISLCHVSKFLHTDLPTTISPVRLHPVSSLKSLFRYSYL